MAEQEVTPWEALEPFARDLELGPAPLAHFGAPRPQEKGWGAPPPHREALAAGPRSQVEGASGGVRTSMCLGVQTRTPHSKCMRGCRGECVPTWGLTSLFSLLRVVLSLQGPEMQAQLRGSLQQGRDPGAPQGCPPAARGTFETRPSANSRPQWRPGRRQAAQPASTARPVSCHGGPGPLPSAPQRVMGKEWDP